MKRKTRKEKVKSQERKEREALRGYVRETDLEVEKKVTQQEVKVHKAKNKYLRQDLTKTIVLTMLAVALELAIKIFFLK